jgi:hypothetical protein
MTTNVGGGIMSKRLGTTGVNIRFLSYFDQN